MFDVREHCDLRQLNGKDEGILLALVLEPDDRELV